MNDQISLEIKPMNGATAPLHLRVGRMFNAGAAGRDREKVERHFRELAELDVPASSEIPALYPVASHLLSCRDTIQVAGPHTVGEVEYVLIWSNKELFVGVGSDQCDYALERYSAVLSKNVCPNFIAPHVWRYEDVAPHFDGIEISSQVEWSGSWQDYQHDTLAALLPPDFWIDKFAATGTPSEGRVLFSGTIATLGGLKSGTGFRYRMIDKVLGREIAASYAITEI